MKIHEQKKKYLSNKILGNLWILEICKNSIDCIDYSYFNETKPKNGLKY